MDAADRVELALSSPVASKTFLLARVQALSTDDLADPSVITRLAAEADRAFYPWLGDNQPASLRAEALHNAPLVRDLIEVAFDDPRNAWWWADLARDCQLWLDDDPNFDPHKEFEIDDDPATYWEIYAQRPHSDHTAVTSTALSVPADDPIKSGLHVEVSRGSMSDWTPSFPLRQATITVSPHARVYEIHQPSDWHRLARTYSDPEMPHNGDANLRSSSGLNNGPAPSWSRVAADWDGVHLSFFGMLTTLYNPTISDGITATLWTWTTERTQWLRSAFINVEDLEPLASQPDLLHRR